MSITHCSLSGNVLTDPVVCIKTGHVYEKSIIVNVINQTGRCPVTNVQLTINDLLPLQVNPASKPKPLTSSSVPGLLQALQDE